MNNKISISFPNNALILNKLVELSKIFPDGFTVTKKDQRLTQYSNIKKPYIVSIKPIFIRKINNNSILSSITYYNTKLPKHCVIGGWWCVLDNCYYVELNKAFKYKYDAIKTAKKYEQIGIFNLKSMGVELIA